MRAMLTMPTASGRYTIDERWGAGGPGDRCLGTDRRLRRTVLLWTVAAPAGDARRDALLALARRGARLTHPAFLRVLDVVIVPDAVTVALEAPSGPRLAPDQFLRGGVSAGLVAAAVLNAGRALDDATRSGVPVQAMPFIHLYWDDASGIRVDPVGTLDGSGDSEPASGNIALLCGLLASLLPAGGRPFTGSVATEDAALRSLLARWQALGDDREPAVFRRLLAELAPLAAPLPAATAGQAIVPAASPDLPTQLLPRAGVDTTAQLIAPASPVATTSTRTAALPPQPAKRRRWSRWRFRSAVVAGALLSVVMQGAVAGWLPGGDGGKTPGGSRDEAVAPANRATLALTAKKDARIRVSVDDAPVFSGVLRAGQSKSWQGSSRVQVWTADGKVLQVTVNGFPLGPLSAAVGHPEWNEVDWGWPVGWKP